MTELTDWGELWVIARRRGIKDPKSCRVVCAGCGSELGAFGIFHAPDCYAGWEQVVFMTLDAQGVWVGVGGTPSANSVIAFGGDD